MLNFCTLFNTYYLAKGLALYYSLEKNCKSFHLYVFAFDETTYRYLSDKRLSHCTIINQKDFENEALLKVKPERSLAEYCWTCTPYTIKYCLETYQLDNCTYLDADTFFYQDPSFIIDKMGNNSVLITPHNYHPLYDQAAMSGIYCVQFTTFKNDLNGLKVLDWWASACLKWCKAYYEDGKMGDQKYLDSWPYMFEGVYVEKGKGVGLAPWNTLNHAISSFEDKLQVDHEPLVFYHFHDLKHLSNGEWYLGGYSISKSIKSDIYFPYIQLLLTIQKEVSMIFSNVDVLGTVNISKVNDRRLKFKIGIYIIDFKKAWKQFYNALFFVARRKYYKDNYIKIN